MDKNKFCLIIAIFIFSLISPLYAQKKTVKEEQKLEQLRLQQQVLRNKALETKLLEEAFEQAIDPETYIIGPGDYFSVIIWGGFQLGIDILENPRFDEIVSPEGILYIPTIGMLEVAGLSLKETKLSIEQKAREMYKNTTITAILTGIRRIRVHVTGEVLNADSYVSTPIDRVSDLISRAGGLTTFAFLQGIKIKHMDDKETIVDFSAFQENGDLDQNPYVKGGDIIIVPPIDYSGPVVKIEGHTEKPGFYPIKPDETLFRFMSRHKLFSPLQKLTHIIIQRDENNSILVDLTGDQLVALKNGDVLILPMDIRVVYIMGAVQRPGSITFVSNLKAKDYVGQAGVTDMAGGINKIRVYHTSTGKIEKGGNAEVYQGDIIEVPIRNSMRISEYLQIGGQIATLIIAYFAVVKN